VILVVLGDLASVAADAVVRPADATLAPASQASRLLDAAAGPSFEKAIARQRDLAVGSAVVTAGGEITAEFAVHCIVGTEPGAATADALRRSLEAALWHCSQWHIGALAVPGLGEGLGPVPAGDAMQVILDAMRGPMRNPEHPATVLIVASTEQEQKRYMARLGPVGDTP
jgi:O-acetyl-ADP-ribose deacetylase (regulator of RNase III)